MIFRKIAICIFLATCYSLLATGISMFKVLKNDKKTKARLGKFTTPHGEVSTPAFFPVATQAAIKGMSTRQLKEIGPQGILVNAYHLNLRPGTEIIKAAGGLHSFMGFDRTIVSDSGGYQVFSLEGLRKVSSEGVEFQSHLDGSRIFLTPEEVVRIQLDLGTDVVLPLDECVKYPTSRDYAVLAVDRTVEWARKSVSFFRASDSKSLFFAISQGATYSELRQECLERLCELDIDGIAVGGLSVGEPEGLRYEMLSLTTDRLRTGKKDCLVYFMGYGKPRDILEAVELGADMFDCVVPTRYGRTGTAFTSRGKLVVRNAEFARDFSPLDENCQCFVCQNYSRAYLRHLINAREIAGAEMLTYHNLWWYKNFIRSLRRAIEEDRFSEFKKEFLSAYKED